MKNVGINPFKDASREYGIRGFSSSQWFTIPFISLQRDAKARPYLGGGPTSGTYASLREAWLIADR